MFTERYKLAPYLPNRFCRNSLFSFQDDVTLMHYCGEQSETPQESLPVTPQVTQDRLSLYQLRGQADVKKETGQTDVSNLTKHTYTIVLDNKQKM